MLTSSRPLDKTQCPNLNCRTCQCLEKGDCTVSNVIYEITCTAPGCNANYIGETYRPLHLRFMEHWRSANNPTATSYVNKPLAKHYTAEHPNTKPSLLLKVLEKAYSTNNRKICEARLISKVKPKLNERSEQIEIQHYLV